MQCYYLIDIAVSPTADSLLQLEIILWISTGYRQRIGDSRRR